MALCAVLLIVTSGWFAVSAGRRGGVGSSAVEFRFVHYRCRFQGQPISDVDLQMEGGRQTLCVTYLGIDRCRLDSLRSEQLRQWQDLLLPLSGGWRLTELPQGCLAFGVGSLTVDGEIPCSPEDPFLRRLLAVVQSQALRLALLSELSFARTDDPSLAASSIASIVEACRAGRIAPDREVESRLRTLAADRTLSPIVRRAVAEGLLELFGKALPAGGTDPGTPPKPGFGIRPARSQPSGNPHDGTS